MATPLVSHALWERLEPLLPLVKSGFRFPRSLPVDWLKFFPLLYGAERRRSGDQTVRCWDAISGKELADAAPGPVIHERMTGPVVFLRFLV